MSKKVTIYTTQYCPYCMMAKRLLESKKIPFEEVDLTTDDAKRSAVEKQTGWMTVPVVLIDGKLVGGYQELADLDASGELDKRLKG